jgi:hypothetical protein
MPRSPADEYRDRLGQREGTLAALTQVDLRLSQVRLAIFALTIAILIAAWRGALSPVWVLVPIAAFIVAAVRHDRTIRGIRIANRAIAFYARGLARLDDRWSGAGEPGDRFADDAHLYARDLDLFGQGSLFQLLSIARTRAGEQILAEWLKVPAARSEILSRHDAVRELAPALDLREAIATSGDEIRNGVDPDALIGWAEGPPLLRRDAHRLAAMVTTAIVVTTGVLMLTGVVSFGVFLIALVVQGAVSAMQRRQVEVVLQTSDAPARELTILRVVLLRLEQERFSAPRLAAVSALLDTRSGHASESIGRLRTLLELHDWQHNIVFAPIGAMLMWDTHLAWAVERWRRAHGRGVRAWLDAAGQFEALASLAAYHYEHPADPFPEIIDSAIIDSAISNSAISNSDQQSAISNQQLIAVAVGHPLIPAAQMITNNVHLAGGTALLVVSGSNMSGKSTLLRTVGVNAVLALAGAPVRAQSLSMTPVTLGATLRIQDSLQEGRSRFYAEITRIRELSLVAARGEPLLFLLDELFHGTNSHDRLVGAAGVLRSFLDRGAIGLITTHDLALTAIADTLPHAVNVHFEDWFEAGEIRFDYTMKPGPVTRSNAVALMRAVGLDVPLE